MRVVSLDPRVQVSKARTGRKSDRTNSCYDMQLPAMERDLISPLG
jgi:hypothetical protein